MEASVTKAKPKLYILFGSQTGQAESIANEIYEEGIFKSQDVSLFCLKDFEKGFDISKINLAIFVCSTTGDGDPPENARKFIRSIMKKTLPPNHLSHLHYTLLGLGDSNYSTFCGGPKRLERALKQGGATSFYRTAFADDGTDMELEVEPWLEGLWDSVEAHCQRLLDFDETEHNNGGVSDPNIDLMLSDNGENNQGYKKIELENFTNTDTENMKSDINFKNSDVQPINEDLTIDLTNINEIVSHIEDLNLGKNEHFQAVLEVENQMQTTLETKPMLRYSTELSKTDLTLPPLGKLHLKVNFRSENSATLENNYQNGAKFPLQSCQTVLAKLVHAKQLTTDNAVKRALEIEMENKGGFGYQPGDSVGICAENSPAEVEWLIKRLNLEEMADKTSSLSLIEVSGKKKSLPSYIPEYFTLREVFTSCVEIRSVPKKPLIRLLAECTTNQEEKRRLLELCSRQGVEHYTTYIRTPSVCILDILALFPSCLPHCSALLQHLPRLQPRRYSLISSPHESNLKFVFNVVKFGIRDGRTFERKGVCTGYIEKLVAPILDHSKNIKTEKLRIFAVPSTGFCLPTNNEPPIVMIGPGTGVAPFIGFLNHRKLLKKSKPDLQFGESWLFFGCRNKDRDYLYEDELCGFVSDKTLTNLHVSFSRDPGEKPKYVQDNIRLHSRGVIQLLLHKNALFYVCGDAKNMSKDVRNCLIEMIADETNCDDVTAKDRFAGVVEEGRYKEDIWA